jgi:hypothetical protein
MFNNSINQGINTIRVRLYQLFHQKWESHLQSF